jgi:hypothetical protein
MESALINKLMGDVEMLKNRNIKGTWIYNDMRENGYKCNSSNLTG